MGKNTLDPRDGNNKLRAIIKDNLLDEEGLKKTALLYHQLYFHEEEYFKSHPEFKDHYAQRAQLFDYDRDMRIFLIREVMSCLYGNKTPSLSVIECAGAGDISAALALPGSLITSVDIDPAIFIISINKISGEWFDQNGMERIISYYNEAEDSEFYAQFNQIVDACVPNYKRVIGDAKNLKYEDETFDFALVQGCTILDLAKKESARVLKSGGYLVSIVEEPYIQEDSSSFYETEDATNPEKDNLALEKIEIPKRLRDYEILCEVNSKDGKFFSGVVFEIFQKK